MAAVCFYVLAVASYRLALVLIDRLWSVSGSRVVQVCRDSSIDPSRCRELVHIVCIKIDFNSVISLHSMTIGVLQVTRRSVLLSHALRRISSVKITPSLSKNRIHIIIKIAPFITFAGIQV